MAPVSYHPAALGDAGEILDLLLALAPEIPLLIDTLEREEALYAVIRRCTRSGESWVAVDEAGRVVGFVLAELAEAGRHYAEHEVIELRHAGVASAFRRQGVFAGLMAKLLARMLPIVTAAPPQNRSGITPFLEKLGFRDAGRTGILRRDPGRGLA